jgi:mono/diheme cytochrome c family protein
MAATPDGAELFRDKKCTKCHTVESHEIAATSDKDPSEITDLSNAGNDFESADAIKAYMLRETEFKGKKHKTKFRGEDSELEAIANWILSLKSS